MEKIQNESITVSALMCSKICHDLISPVGAIVNGLEVLESEDSKEMQDFAISLLRKSADQASAKLQSARMAWGAASGVGQTTETNLIQKLAEMHMAFERPNLTWQIDNLLVDKTVSQLILNLVLISASTIPRGGNIVATLSHDTETDTLRLNCNGSNSRIPQEFNMLTSDEQVDLSGLTARNIHYYFARMLANEANAKIAVEKNNDEVTITCLLKLTKNQTA